MLSSAHCLILNFVLSVWVALILGRDNTSRPIKVYFLEVTSDGPTILGGTTTFLASLSAVGETGTGKDKYMYIWRDTRQIWISPEPIFSHDRNCSYQRIYWKKADLGKHAMNVEVFYQKRKIAESSAIFEVTDYITAGIISSQNETVCKEPLCNAATNQSLRLTVSIHDPSKYLRENSFLFDWYLGDGDEIMRSSLMSVAHSYNTTGEYPVRVDITAIKTNGRTVTGTAYLTILALDVIQNLTVLGVDHVVVGEERQINVTCHGSPPVSFCWSMSELTSDVPPSQESCLQSYLLDECQMAIQHQFNSSQKYLLSIQASNDVSNQSLALSISPEVPTDIKPEGIVGVIIGILFGLSLTIFGISIMIRQVQRSRRKHIEVADFNFEASASYDSIREHARRLNDIAAANEKTPLLSNNRSLDVRWEKGEPSLTLEI